MSLQYGRFSKSKMRRIHAGMSHVKPKYLNIQSQRCYITHMTNGGRAIAQPEWKQKFKSYIVDISVAQWGSVERL